MESIGLLLHGFLDALTGWNVLCCLLGVTVGMLVCACIRYCDAYPPDLWNGAGIRHYYALWYLLWRHVRRDNHFGSD
ncbi:MAG: hypothetical protein L7F78_06570 [Syntrophales bacterium LBB04]|nr:hypothetical protein [Syntrophales bacterium LBB04]